MIRALALCLAGLALCAAPDGHVRARAEPFAGEMHTVPALPTLALQGPYGEPSRLAPALHARAVWSTQGVSTLAEPPGGDRSRPTRSGASSTTTPAGLVKPKTGVKTDDDDEDDEEDAPRKPGTLSTDFVKIPNPTPNIRSRSLGPHLTPDAEFEINSTTTMGVLGRADRIDVRGGAGVVPSLKARDLGAGLVLQYKLGGP